MEEIIRIFIGYDPIQSVAYHVLVQSIMDRTSRPVSITPLSLNHLNGIYSKKREPLQTSDFSISRFLVPYIAGYKGHVIFLDCDMLCRDDISDLWAHRRFDKAVQVIKHEYEPSTKFKFLGHKQATYQMKNWSSVMIFNCDHYNSRRLTPEYINKASGLELHQFSWCDEERIGELPREWNHLVGEYPYNVNAKLVHFTIGGPYFHEYENCDYADEWFAMHRKMTWCEQLDGVIRLIKNK